ncbi:hypothetical protein MRB53_011799 [Persea americana]|uniref:Uncharacterized protein n=1 Tax=Persea americana TaxID=3435 RepID=A0ACC2LX60_PERAE|nr:hypothetical protein MRB53_011799 [Persea americana]
MPSDDSESKVLIRASKTLPSGEQKREFQLIIMSSTSSWKFSSLMEFSEPFLFHPHVESHFHFLILHTAWISDTNCCSTVEV